MKKIKFLFFIFLLQSPHLRGESEENDILDRKDVQRILFGSDPYIYADDDSVFKAELMASKEGLTANAYYLKRLK